LVTVPVRLVSATRSLDVRFNQLDADSGSRIRYRRVADATGEEVPTEKIVKGYEIEPGQYVVVDAEELAALAPKKSRAIEIEDFVDLADIDPVYFEQPYYLIPDKDAAKPYQLLVGVMQEMGKVAIGRFVLRSKEALVAIRPVDGVLCLETMRYADEVLAADRDAPIPEPAAEPSERELEMARQLVQALSGTFDADKYHDEYREELLALIERKASGEEIVATAPPEEPAKVLDLMAALEASLARSGATNRVGAGASSEVKDTSAGAAKRTRAAPAKATTPGKRAAKKAAPRKAAAAKTPAKRARKSA
jgi:DNA end-binding protein Ku